MLDTGYPPHESCSRDFNRPLPQAVLTFMPDILLVEDKESLRCVLRMTLENAGYSVTEAADARGYHRVRSHPSPRCFD